MARKHNLAEVLQTEVSGSMPLKALAKVLAGKGRRGDTMLAHITPKEAKKLKKMGGSGTTNPETGLPEFFPDDGYTVDFSQAEPVVTETPSPPTADFGGDFRNQASYDYVAPTSEVISASPVSTTPSLTDQILSNYRMYNAQNYAGSTNFGLDPTSQQFSAVTTPGGAPLTSQSQIAALTDAAGKGSDITTPPPATDQQQVKDQQQTKDQQKSFTDKLLAGLSEPKNLLGLGIAGAGGLVGYLGRQRAAQQAKAAQAQIAAAYNQAAQQQKDLAQPLIGPGYTQLSQALQGSLSPANMQAYQAAQARAAQASARSGGVGAVQTALQEEALRQQLLANQQTQALALIAPGNTMLQNAIQNQINATTQGLGMSLQLQQQANQAANQMYASLGGAVAGGMLKG